MKNMSTKPNKTRIIEIAAYVAAVNGINRSAAINVVTDAFNFVAEELKAGNEVHIQSLGKFVTAQQAERNVRNPSTGEMMVVPARRVARFKPSTALRDGLNSAEGRE